MTCRLTNLYTSFKLQRSQAKEFTKDNQTSINWTLTTNIKVNNTLSSTVTNVVHLLSFIYTTLNNFSMMPLVTYNDYIDASGIKYT